MRGRTIRSASVIGSADWFTPLLVLTLLPLVIMLVAVIYLTVKYTPVIGRIFQAQPFFMPVKVQPSEHGESVEFMTEDGLRLCGTYLRSRTSEQAGVLVYCHEYLSDRWSFHPYLDQFRDLGFDLFTFDFRNHGESDLDPEYAAMQWTTDHETRDLRAALAYLRSRHDHDPAGFGLFGVSRGGTTALIVAASEPDVWGVITDGAFPTQGTVVSYILRWAQIFVPSPVLRGLIPLWPALDRARARLPVPQCRGVGDTAGTTPVAHDSWHARHVYRARYRQVVICVRQEPQGTVAGSRRQAQSLPGNRPGKLRGTIADFLRAIRSAPALCRCRGSCVPAPRACGRLWACTGPVGPDTRNGDARLGMTGRERSGQGDVRR
jgi:pimeloyl-ACP methyl ester carboxylesterase